MFWLWLATNLLAPRLGLWMTIFTSYCPEIGLNYHPIGPLALIVFSWASRHFADEHIAPPNPLQTGKWHAVVAGRKVGVWADWTEMASYVLNVPGNRHKSFATRSEALLWYYRAKVDGNVVVIAE